jgi:drug/metabolite transporter (DMT)-like permease
VLLALVVLGEKLGAIQLLGGALVLAAVIPATLAATRAKIPVTQR